ncbi:hypothetical protein [Enterococcus villorum]|uniref:Membrane protein 6-pyruvoyl-tetrahydropterin synthase-related domain-containing protein n=2 Tax=Enterococcus villorum TaxID=112904 RepID=A0A511J330_9ENTE|nr:hypothetical protein [Enterococcus villorum]EOH89641.1 hypothetical protein UAO_01327 [Enterococcus villorum ATCC 700913]EOW78312.1 hypothetical protein I591_01168 [Enterococcus villorum ATCC 700913]GEL92418.1 hypothetical protein EVI01_17550 [Enterococcus villorum]
MSKQGKNLSLAVLIISLCSFFMISPQIYRHALIVSNDWVFHMNRFYETAMQIKNGTFNYFQSIYGFEQSGRVINALYGTDFAYLSGFLLLILKNWFRFQLVSNFLCYFAAGMSMYFLSRYCKLEQKVAVGTAILYMGTPTIFFYSLAQNFSGWGAAFLPLVFIPAVRMVNNKEKPIQPAILGGIISVILSVHMFSTLLAVVALFPFFLVGFIRCNKKVAMIKDALFAVLITIGLSFNTFAAFFDLSKDTLISPYPVTDLLSNSTSLSFGAISWTNFGLILSIIFIFQLVNTCLNFSRISLLEKVVNIVGLLFLFVSSKYFPWNDLGNHFAFIQKMQFPQRLGCIACILLLLGWSFTIQTVILALKKNTMFTLIPILLTFSLLNLTGGHQLIMNTANIWNSDAPLSKDTNAAQTLETNATKIRQKFGGNSDLSEALKIHKKPMADYLPTYATKIENPYKLYNNEVLNNKISLKKKIDKQGRIHLIFASENTEKVTLPVIIYINTTIDVNGKSKNEIQYSLTPIGALEISPKVGKNEVVIGYQPNILFRMSFVIRILTFIIIISFYSIKYRIFYQTEKISSILKK